MFTTARNYGLKLGVGPRPSSQLGFTLIEAMVVVAVFVILTLIAVPSFRNLLLDNRRTALANDLVSTIAIARSEAARRGQTVRVCASSNGSSCLGSTNWNTGWIVIADVAGGGTDVLKYVSNDGGDNTITSNQQQYSFQPFVARVVGGTITICDSRGSAQARAIVVGPSGVPRVGSTDADGGALSCS